MGVLVFIFLFIIASMIFFIIADFDYWRRRNEAASKIRCEDCGGPVRVNIYNSNIPEDFDDSSLPRYTCKECGKAID